ncbi:MAG: NAD(P)-dependent oxidoreductase [Patescibacteria group bacterium]|nr:NAD(P)-dependent oxidoreductase [Patescibacteria group bacterium]
MKKLLITGSSGGVGQIIAKGLAKEYEIHGLDVKDGVDITDLAALESYFSKLPEIAAIIHLAADAYPFASWGLVLKHNVIGTRNVYECAVKHHVPKVVFTGSTHAFGAYPGYPTKLIGKKTLDINDPFRPDGWYGWSKAAGEILARLYADQYGVSSAVLRIGHVAGLGQFDPQLEKLEISQEDLIKLTRQSLDCREKFKIFTAVSRHKDPIFSPVA